MDWFCECNGEPENDEALDIEELRAGLKELGFRKKGIERLQLYLDPDKDGDIDVDEFKGKLELVGEPSKVDAEDLAAAQSLEKLEKHIEKEGMKVSEMFKKIDRDGGGEVDGAEMKV